MTRNSIVLVKSDGEPRLDEAFARFLDRRELERRDEGTSYPEQFEDRAGIPPEAHLLELRDQFDRWMLPADAGRIKEAVALIFGSYRPVELTDQQAFTQSLIHHLAPFPASVLREMVTEIQATLKFFPSIAEIVAIASALREQQLRRSAVVAAMLGEHARRKAENERRAAAAEANWRSLLTYEEMLDTIRAGGKVDKESLVPAIRFLHTRDPERCREWVKALRDDESWSVRFGMQVAVCLRLTALLEMGALTLDRARSAIVLAKSDPAAAIAMLRVIEDAASEDAVNAGRVDAAIQRTWNEAWEAGAHERDGLDDFALLLETTSQPRSELEQLVDQRTGRADLSMPVDGRARSDRGGDVRAKRGRDAGVGEGDLNAA